MHHAFRCRRYSTTVYLYYYVDFYILSRSYSTSNYTKQVSGIRLHVYKPVLWDNQHTIIALQYSTSVIFVQCIFLYTEYLSNSRFFLVGGFWADFSTIRFFICEFIPFSHRFSFVDLLPVREGLIVVLSEFSYADFCIFFKETFHRGFTPCRSVLIGKFVRCQNSQLRITRLFRSFICEITLCQTHTGWFFLCPKYCTCGLLCRYFKRRVLHVGVSGFTVYLLYRKNYARQSWGTAWRRCWSSPAPSRPLGLGQFLFLILFRFLTRDFYFTFTIVTQFQSCFEMWIVLNWEEFIWNVDEQSCGESFRKM